MTSLHKLSLPKSIVNTTNDDSFSRDLLRQFDKRRSKLHFELGLLSQEPSPESSIINNNREDYSNIEPIQLDHDTEEEEEGSPTRQKRGASSSFATRSSKRSSSASDLFRRSSAYLISKLNLIKKNKSEDDHLQTTTNNRQTKLYMKTTIAVPTTNNDTRQQLDQISTTPNPTIPVITQYPPKPLVYSPVEPIPDNMLDQQKPLLHRISMPLLRVYHDTHSLTRNKSIASLVTRRRKSEPDRHHHTKRK